MLFSIFSHILALQSLSAVNTSRIESAIQSPACCLCSWTWTSLHLRWQVSSLKLDRTNREAMTCQRSVTLGHTVSVAAAPSCRLAFPLVIQCDMPSRRHEMMFKHNVIKDGCELDSTESLTYHKVQSKGLKGCLYIIMSNNNPGIVFIIEKWVPGPKYTYIFSAFITFMITQGKLWHVGGAKKKSFRGLIGWTKGWDMVYLVKTDLGGKF